jgi:hypothetical protein
VPSHGDQVKLRNAFIVFAVFLNGFDTKPIKGVDKLTTCKEGVDFFPWFRFSLQVAAHSFLRLEAHPNLNTEPGCSMKP